MCWTCEARLCARKLRLVFAAVVAELVERVAQSVPVRLGEQSSGVQAVLPAGEGACCLANNPSRATFPTYLEYIMLLYTYCSQGCLRFQ